MVRDITPTIYGLPGLPKWLDLPLIKRMAEKYGITVEEARERLRLNTLCELVPVHKADFKPLDYLEEETTTKGETRGKTDENDAGAEACVRLDRESLSKEPRDAPPVSSEDGW